MFFWFFESRKDAKTAPLALWLNGGPGCSSMIGLFQENGPCTFNNGGSKPTLNPNSWNTFANMVNPTPYPEVQCTDRSSYMLINPSALVSATALMTLYRLSLLLLESGISSKLSTLSFLSMRTVTLVFLLSLMVDIMVPSLRFTLSSRTLLLMLERSRAKRSTS